MTKTFKIKIISFAQVVLMALIILVPNMALAQTCEPPLKADPTTKLCLPDNPYTGSAGLAGAKSIGEVITIVLKILLTLAGVVAVVFIIYAGYSYVTSGGNEEQSTKAKKILLNAILGLVLIILAFVIVSVLTNTLTTGNIFSGSSSSNSPGNLPPPPGP